MSIDVRLAARRGDFVLDVAFAHRGVVAIVGPNGSGKSTLLRAIAGALRDVRGRVSVDDRILLDTDAGFALPVEARAVGYAPQGGLLFPHLDVVQNVAFGLRTEPPQERRRLVAEMLETLGLAELANAGVRGLSGGEAQRVALARALAPAPRLILLDEPLAALDAVVRRATRAWLAERVVTTPTILATHDARDVAALDAHVIVLERGRVVQRGSLAQLRAEPATEFVAAFVAE